MQSDLYPVFCLCACVGSEMQDMDQNTTQRSPAAGCTVEDLFLATATVQAEATGSQTPLVKEELR